ncbi:MAG: hypothetical protein ACFFDF_23240, partial [Candidatus Odinarchaeota archaeon]
YLDAEFFFATEEYIDALYDYMELYKKILLVGPPNSGKTSIKKVFFDNIDPSSILENPLTPTRGVRYTHLIS